MDPRLERARHVTRRWFLDQCRVGLGALALPSLLGGSAGAAEPRRPGGADEPLTPRPPPAPARARSVIYLHMAGSPPQHDLFDPKPRLQELDGTPCPREFIENRRLAFIKGHPTLLGSPYRSRRCGREGVWISEAMPNFSRVVDDVTLVRSMVTDQFNHAPAQLYLYTGSAQFGAASMGSWVTWGLGSLNQNLPGFVVMISGGTDPSGGKSLWSSGYLPSVHQGVQLRGSGDPILYVSDPPGMSRAVRRRSLDALRRLNEMELEEGGDPETRTRIDQYELAFRMQVSVPDVMDISREPEAVQLAYGATPGRASFANNCLLARRLVERGVRYVQLYDWGWDIHGTGKHDDLMTQFPKKCREVDQPIAALLLDLKQRGLLDETLVVWGGEFGRTSMNEKRDGSKFLGRDHHPDCFTMWLAGGGIRRGMVYGSTDELGYFVTENPVTVHDLQATILHLLGLDPYRLAYSYQGLRQRLIGPAEGPRVVRELIG